MLKICSYAILLILCNCLLCKNYVIATKLNKLGVIASNSMLVCLEFIFTKHRDYFYCGEQQRLIARVRMMLLWVNYRKKRINVAKKYLTVRKPVTWSSKI